MEREYTTIDKSSWPRGEWDSEPDKAQWVDEATGLPCLIVRNPGMGNLCGYVGVAPGHPLYEVEYDGAQDSTEVHGDLTFSSFCDDSASEERGICHKVEEGEEEKIWWFGFDCAHGFDVSPGNPYLRGEMSTYKNVAYVKAECRALAGQLAEEHEEDQSEEKD